MTAECTRPVLNSDCLLTFPTSAQHQERDVLLAFNEDLGNALAKACELDTDNDADHLAHAGTAQIVRRHIIRDDKMFNRFPPGCQQDSVPSVLLALISMILEGPIINIIVKAKHQWHCLLPSCSNSTV